MGSFSLNPYAVAQNNAFLKLGPFMFDSQTSLEAIYTTNVEQQRPSEAEAEMEDSYLVWSLDLKSTTDFLPSTELTLDTGITIEEHFNRPDLNNSDNPFGRLFLSFVTDVEPVKFSADALLEHTSESVEDKYVPPGREFPRKKRQEGYTFDYGAAANWNSDRLALVAEYREIQERYADDESKIDDNDKQTESYGAIVDLALIRGIQIGAGYSIEYTTTEFINDVGGVREEDTETIDLKIAPSEQWFARPKIDLSIGLQKEYTDGESDGWETVYTITVSDELDITPSLNLEGAVGYKREEDPEADDIQFTYSAILTHELSARASQKLSAKREPVDTLGSTSETDSSAFDYTLSINDFLLRQVRMSTGIGLKIDKPVESEEERTQNFLFSLSHMIPINTRLTREFRYDYTVEDSNLEKELLEEHRVTLSFVYQL